MRFLANSLTVFYDLGTATLPERRMDTPPGNDRERGCAFDPKRSGIPGVSFSPATNFDEDGEIDGRFAVTRAKFVRLEAICYRMMRMIRNDR